MSRRGPVRSWIEAHANAFPPSAAQVGHVSFLFLKRAEELGKPRFVHAKARCFIDVVFPCPWKMVLWLCLTHSKWIQGTKNINMFQEKRHWLYPSGNRINSGPPSRCSLKNVLIYSGSQTGKCFAKMIFWFVISYNAKNSLSSQSAGHNDE